MKNTDQVSDSDRERVESHLLKRAVKVKTLPERWIHGHEEGESYCPRCAAAKLAELLIAKPDGDYAVGGSCESEGDSTPFCESCGTRLRNTLTDYGCESELDHFQLYGFDPSDADDCYSLLACINSRGWVAHDFDHERDDERRYRAEYFANLYALCRAILFILDNPDPRREAKAERAQRNAIRASGHRRSYWWRVYRRWARTTLNASQ
jgi:hypothetical protein